MRQFLLFSICAVHSTHISFSINFLPSSFNPSCFHDFKTIFCWYYISEEGAKAVAGNLPISAVGNFSKKQIHLSLQHHYSISGGASAVGLGTENCVQVKCDEK